MNRLLEHTGKFDFADRLFKYVDTNNSKRLLDWMIGKYYGSEKEVGVK